MDELWINNDRFQLSPDTVIAINLAVNDLAEIQNRQGSYTNQFKGVLNEWNKSLLENAENITSGTLLPYRKIAAKVSKNGIEFKGFAIIESSDTSYNITFYSGLTDFFARIDGLSIRALPGLATLAPVWDLTTVYNSRTNTSGFIYQIIDFGALNNVSHNFDIRKQLPSVYNSTIVDAIFSYAGFNKSGDFLTDQRYLKEVTPCVGNADAQLSDEFIHSRLYKAALVIPHSITSTLTVGGGIFLIPHCSDDAVLGFDYGSHFNPATFGFTSDGTYRMRLKGILNFNVTIQVDYAVMMVINGILSVPFMGDLANPGNNVKNFTTGWLTVNPGDVVQMYICATPYNGSPTFQPCTFTFNAGTYVYNEIDANPGIGFTYDIRGLLPDVQAKDFLKAIAQRYGIIYDNHSPNNTIRLVQFKEIADSRATSSVDWSKKLDLSVKPKIEYRIGSYGKSNLLKYKPDPTVVPATLGNGSFGLDDDTLPLSIDVVQMVFAATQMTTKLLGLDVPFIDKYDSANGTLSKKVEARVLYADTQTLASGSVNYTDGTSSISETVNIPLCYFILASESVNLGFDNSLVGDNYGELRQVLLYAKKITANFYLNQADITELDFFKAVFVEYFSHWFYLNKIINYRGKDNLGKELSTQVELLRL